jgi:hypothetical protein
MGFGFWFFNFFPDLLIVIFLFICSWYSYKIYKKISATPILLMLLAFSLIACFDIGFLVIDFMPLGDFNRGFAEVIVAVRVFPIAFLMVSMALVYRTVVKYLNGRKK